MRDIELARDADREFGFNGLLTNADSRHLPYSLLLAFFAECMSNSAKNL